MKIADEQIDNRELDHDHQFEGDCAHLTLLDEIEQGLEDVKEGRTVPANALRQRLREKTPDY